MVEKGGKKTFPVGRIGRFLKSKKKKPVKVRVQRKKKRFVGAVPPSSIQAILNIRGLMLLEYAKDQARHNKNAHVGATRSQRIAQSLHD